MAALPRYCSPPSPPAAPKVARRLNAQARPIPRNANHLPNLRRLIESGTFVPDDAVINQLIDAARVDVQHGSRGFTAAMDLSHVEGPVAGWQVADGPSADVGPATVGALLLNGGLAAENNQAL